MWATVDLQWTLALCYEQAVARFSCRTVALETLTKHSDDYILHLYIKLTCINKFQFWNQKACRARQSLHFLLLHLLCLYFLCHGLKNTTIKHTTNQLLGNKSLPIFQQQVGDTPLQFFGSPVFQNINLVQEVNLNTKSGLLYVHQDCEIEHVNIQRFTGRHMFTYQPNGSYALRLALVIAYNSLKWSRDLSVLAYLLKSSSNFWGTNLLQWRFSIETWLNMHIVVDLKHPRG